MNANSLLQKKILSLKEVEFLKTAGYVVSIYPRRKEVVVNGFKRFSFKG